MNTMIFIAFIGMSTGLFLILGMTPLSFVEETSKRFQKEDDSLLSRIQKVKGKRKKRGPSKLIEDTKVILEATNKSNQFTKIIIVSLCLMVLGAFSAVSMNNLFLVPVLTIGFSLIPFWYIKFTATRWKKELNNELETTLSIITTSYLRSESILTAIDENIEYIHPPVYDVFRAFLTQTRLINANMKRALENLKKEVDSAVFHEWVDAVIACQEDKNLKSTLTPIVSKLSDMRIVSGELDYLLYEPVKEFVTMAVLLVANIPLMYFLNRDWYNTLLYHTIGQVVLAFCATVLFVAIAGVVHLSKPVEYRR